MWTNIDNLNVPAGTLIFCEGIQGRVAIVEEINGRVITFRHSGKCGMGRSIKIYVPNSKEMEEHLLKLREMFASGDKTNYELALMVLESVTNE